MRLYTGAAMRELDGETIRQGLVPSLVLMERAGCAFAQAAIRRAQSRSAAIFCGTGNNGGDGFAAAPILLRAGFQVRLFLVGSREKLTPDAAEMERRFLAAGGSTEPFSPDSPDIAAFTRHSGVVLDAIFGFGLNAPIRGNAEKAVALINGADAPVVSADLPSGIAADTGSVLGCAVRAAQTVTFTAPKVGHFVLPGALYTGELTVADIGIPPQRLESTPFAARTVDGETVRLPRRPRDGHKGTFGRALLLGGSVGLTGAPLLSADGCLHTGAGLISLGVPREIYELTAVRCREVMPFPLPSREGKLSVEAVPEILRRLENADACLVGPGLGRSEAVTEIVCTVLQKAKCQMILDADGINAVSAHTDILRETPRPCVLTPHDGEYARLHPDPAGGRMDSARAFAHKHRCVLVLKGYHTIIAPPEGPCLVNTTGNPGMAKGGSGDVLGGMITSLAAQGFSPVDAAAFGVYLHGLAGDLAAEQYGEYAMTPSDLISCLPAALQSVTEG